MAYRLEKNGEDRDIVIDGFEKGIADSPYLGLADVRNADISSYPGEAAVGFATAGTTAPPIITGVAFTVAAANDTFIWTGTPALYNGCAIRLNTLTGGTGLATGAVYWVGLVSGTTFKVYTEPGQLNVVNVTLDGSGTFSTFQLDLSTEYARSTVDYNYGTFIVDSAVQAWWVVPSNNANGTANVTANTLIYLGNISSPASFRFGLSITSFNGYLFVFTFSQIDYVSLSSFNVATTWHYNWQALNQVIYHDSLAATDNAVYFCNGTVGVGSILVNAGSTFNPATPTTYSFNSSALALPPYDTARCLAQLGVLLLVGGLQNFIYPWDRVSTSFSYPLICAENNIQRLVTSNSSTYIFAGNRGRIYITNGSNIDLYKKIPDYIAGTLTPYFTWGPAMYWRNQLVFAFSGTDNAGTTINNFSGAWAITVSDPQAAYAFPTAGALRMLNQPSYGSYAGAVRILSQNVTVSSPGGEGIYLGWQNSTTYGVDYTSSTPYTNFQTYIDTDLIPIGTYYDQSTDQQVEYKLSRPLVTGESVKIYWRGDLTASFTQINNVTAVVGELSGAGPVNFQKQQWIQLRLALSSTASNPSFTQLREARIR